jgi:P-type Cu+ transporter
MVAPSNSAKAGKPEAAQPLKRTQIACMATTTLKVDGMTCGACTSAVESGFKNVEGAGAVSVNLVMGRAVVQHDPTILSADKIAEIIEDRGFDAEVLSTSIPMPTTASTVQQSSKSQDVSLEPQMTMTTLSVQGMTCGACTSAIEAGFKGVAGVKTMSVSLLSERVVVEHDPSIISAEQVAEIIEDRGFDAAVLDSKLQEAAATSATGTGTPPPNQALTTTVAIEGMTCGACTSAVEGAFKDVNGLIQFNISLLAERAVITHEPSNLSADKIVEIIEDAGFDAKLISSQSEASQHLGTSSTVQLKLYGLSDGAAATALETLLRAKPGVIGAVLSLSTSRVTITYNPSLTGLRALVEIVEGAGYNALVAESDDNNAQLESLAKTKEIQEWRRAFLYSLSFAVPVFCISMLIPMFLPALDFGAIRLIPGLYLGDLVCGLLTCPVQFGIGKRFYISAFKSIKHKSPTMDVLVILGTSAAFFFSVFAMLVAIIIPPHTRPGTVFDTSTMLITFITLGRWLENRAKGQTSKALSRLMSLAPSMATIYDDPIAAEKAAEGWSLPSSPTIEKHSKMPEGSAKASLEKTIPTELIQVGDIVILRPGDKVPADGTVTRGESYVDESMVTGEAIPLMKKKGSLLMAGTVNGAGRIDFRVTRAGKDTQLSQIVNLVQEAQTSRAPIQRMADYVAGYFVPIIIALGLSTFVGWMILSHVMPNPPKVFVDERSGGKFMVCLKLCISVIVFACPCALGLATPTAVMVGTGVGAEHGILVKGGAALETATKITHVVLDKTGTLTFGKLKVAETSLESTWSSNEWRRRLWWTIVGLAESGSEHPIGKAICAAATEQLGRGDEDGFDGSVGAFEATVGRGIAVEVEPHSSAERTRYQVLIGNAVFIRSKGIAVPDHADPDSNRSTSAATSSVKSDLPAGVTYIHVAISNHYAGTLAMSDTLKPTAAAAITALHRLGINTSLVTGDTYSTALHIANLVGISKDSIRASVSPGQKQMIIGELQSQGEIVAMVGDGINDSPALASANVGIGLVSGSDIAVEAADIVIMRPDDLLNIPASLCLSRTIFTRIKMNLIWACVYNLIGLPFAMGIFLPFGGFMLPPMAAGLMMAASSVSVVTSSLLLKWWRQPSWLNVESLEQDLGKQTTYLKERQSGVGLFSRVGDIISSALRTGTDRGRGAYVPLGTVEPPV